MKRNSNILNSFCLLGFYEISFRGYSESNDSVNKGNYKDLIHFIPYGKKKMFFFKITWETESFKCNSPVVNVALNIKRKYQIAIFISIVLDKTTDIRNISQLSTIADHYVTRKRKLKIDLQAIFIFHLISICYKNQRM